jgi:hypothetical protein
MEWEGTGRAGLAGRNGVLGYVLFKMLIRGQSEDAEGAI